jgi:hypothetical protein
MSGRPFASEPVKTHSQSLEQKRAEALLRMQIEQI